MTCAKKKKNLSFFLICCYPWQCEVWSVKLVACCQRVKPWAKKENNNFALTSLILEQWINGSCRKKKKKRKARTCKRAPSSVLFRQRRRNVSAGTDKADLVGFNKLKRWNRRVVFEANARMKKTSLHVGCRTPMTSPWHQHNFFQPSHWQSADLCGFCLKRPNVNLVSFTVKKKGKLWRLAPTRKNKISHFNLTPKRPSPPTANLVTDLKLCVGNLENNPSHSTRLFYPHLFFFDDKSPKLRRIGAKYDGGFIPDHRSLEKREAPCYWVTRQLECFQCVGRILLVNRPVR